MMILWMLSAALLAIFSILLHTLVTRWMDPSEPVHSMKRFWLLMIARLVLIGVFFWQLVQQELSILIASLVIFLAVYAGSLYYIINKKPHWFQPALKKEIPAWKP